MFITCKPHPKPHLIGVVRKKWLLWTVCTEVFLLQLDSSLKDGGLQMRMKSEYGLTTIKCL